MTSHTILDASKEHLDKSFFYQKPTRMKLHTLYLLILCFHTPSWGQNTVGLTDYSQGNKEGYVLFSPMTSTNTYLIDKCGEKVHDWTTSAYRPALSSVLLEDGSLMRTGKLNNANFNEGGSGGIIEHFDWDGNLIWSYTLSTSENCMHHDFKVLPNGNILCIAWCSCPKQCIKYSHLEAL